MAVVTTLNIVSEDAQGYQDTLQFVVKPIAFATAPALPVAAKIEAVINSIYSLSDTPSASRVINYYIKVEETAPGATGGNGEPPTSERARVRNALDAVPGNWLFSIPGLNKAAVSFDPTNPNSISTSGAMWDAIRTALTDAAIAVSDPAGAYEAATSDEIAQVASAFDGRRAPLRPR